MGRSVVRVVVLGMVAASLSVIPALVSPAVAGGTSGSIRLVSPAKPVILGSQITLKGRFKHGGHRAYVIEKRKVGSLKWRAIGSTNGTTNGRGVYKATFKPKHTYKFRAVLTATATKLTRISKTLKVVITAQWQSGASAISAGSDHTCGIRTDQSLWCWGDNGYGDVGNGSNLQTMIPVKVKDGYATQTWSDVSAGYSYTCGVRTDGSLWCWGDNGLGELGLGDTAERHVPVRVGTASDWASVSASDLHTCAIKTDDSLYCWGDNTYGELGDGSDGGTVRTPKLVDDSGVNTSAPQTWSSISLGSKATCGIRTDQSLWCWGSNDHGQLGINVAAGPGPISVPTAVGSASWDFVSAASWTYNTALPAPYTGGGYTCGVQTDQTLWCWGDNSFGQFGNATPSSTPTIAPVKVDANTDWTEIHAGGGQTCGIRGDSDVYCWGYNLYGQVGDGSYTQRDAIPVSPLTTAFNGLTTGSDHTCAVYSDHTLRCWGLGSTGQLGNGSGGNRPKPKVTDAG